MGIQDTAIDTITVSRIWYIDRRHFSMQDHTNIRRITSQ